MSRNTDGLPMLPPWLSEDDVTQTGEAHIGYEAPVQNLPHDDLITESPTPKRSRFKLRSSDDDRSDQPERQEKRRKGRRRDRNNEQPLQERVGELLPGQPVSEPGNDSTGDQQNGIHPDRAGQTPPGQPPQPNSGFAPPNQAPPENPAAPPNSGQQWSIPPQPDTSAATGRPTSEADGPYNRADPYQHRGSWGPQSGFQQQAPMDQQRAPREQPPSSGPTAPFTGHAGNAAHPGTGTAAPAPQPQQGEHGPQQRYQSGRPEFTGQQPNQPYEDLRPPAEHGQQLPVDSSAPEAVPAPDETTVRFGQRPDLPPPPPVDQTPPQERPDTETTRNGPTVQHAPAAQRASAPEQAPAPTQPTESGHPPSEPSAGTTQHTAPDDSAQTASADDQVEQTTRHRIADAYQSPAREQAVPDEQDFTERPAPPDSSNGGAAPAAEPARTSATEAAPSWLTDRPAREAAADESASSAPSSTAQPTNQLPDLPLSNYTAAQQADENTTATSVASTTTPADDSAAPEGEATGADATSGNTALHGPEQTSISISEHATQATRTQPQQQEQVRPTQAPAAESDNRGADGGIRPVDEHAGSPHGGGTADPATAEYAGQPADVTPKPGPQGPPPADPASDEPPAAHGQPATPQSPHSSAPQTQAPQPSTPHTQAPQSSAPQSAAPQAPPSTPQTPQPPAPEQWRAPAEQSQMWEPRPFGNRAPEQPHAVPPPPQGHPNAAPNPQQAPTPDPYVPDAWHRAPGQQGGPNPAPPGPQYTDRAPQGDPHQYGPASPPAYGPPGPHGHGRAPGQPGPNAGPGGPGPSLDDLPMRRAKKAPGSGWRKAVHHASRGSVNPGLSAEERRLQELVARIRQPVRGDYRIAVLSLKGGVGKTTTTTGIGSTFASIRGDRVIAVDANPDFGTLSQRVALQTKSTVRDLLLDPSIQRYSDVRRHTSQSGSRLEVLASERDPAASEAFNEEEYRSVARILQRFYNIVLTDCGTGLMHSAMQGVLGLAHSLVLISPPAIDGARSAAATLDWLSLHGHDHLVRNAVVVINSPRAGSPNVEIQQLREYFLARCRAVHTIPFDPHMSEGAEIDLLQLQKQTKRAYVELAATVADDFATVHRRPDL